MFVIASFVAVIGSLFQAGGSGLVPGDGIMLEPTPPVVSPIGLPAPPRAPAGSGSPFPYAALGTALLAAGTAVQGRRRRNKGTDPVYVVVHGNGGSPDDFEGLLAMMGVSEEQVVRFDYRSVAPFPSSTEASRVVSTRAAAAELDELIRAVAQNNENVYSIHHSKGSAVGVEMIADLDAGIRPPIAGYRGAALLDPAIASGPLGMLQRAGFGSTLIPDNGDFDPVRCSGDQGCRDVRDHLGEASGVEVIAIRNPDAGVTNFRGEPDGLRTYDLENDGGVSAFAPFRSPWGIVRRIFGAHRSVLWSWAVADCVKAESRRAGSCVWKGASHGRRPLWGSGNARNMVT